MADPVSWTNRHDDGFMPPLWRRFCFRYCLCLCLYTWRFQRNAGCDLHGVVFAIEYAGLEKFCTAQKRFKRLHVAPIRSKKLKDEYFLPRIFDVSSCDLFVFARYIFLNKNCVHTDSASFFCRRSVGKSKF